MYIEDKSVTVVTRDLPTTIHGFICLGEDYEPCIIINSRLPQEIQRRTFAHELRHLSSGQLYDEGYVEYA